MTFRDMQQFSIKNFLSELQITLSSMPSSEDVNSSLNTLLTSFENGNGLLFHMTQPISRSTIKAIACSKPTISEH